MVLVDDRAFLPFRDAMRERHVEAGDPQELVALARVAKLLGRTHTLQRFSSVPVTPGHSDIPILECVDFKSGLRQASEGSEIRHMGDARPGSFPREISKGQAPFLIDGVSADRR